MQAETAMSGSGVVSAQMILGRVCQSHMHQDGIKHPVGRDCATRAMVSCGKPLLESSWEHTVSDPAFLSQVHACPHQIAALCVLAGWCGLTAQTSYSCSASGNVPTSYADFATNAYDLHGAGRGGIKKANKGHKKR